MCRGWRCGSNGGWRYWRRLCSHADQRLRRFHRRATGRADGCYVAEQVSRGAGRRRSRLRRLRLYRCGRFRNSGGRRLTRFTNLGDGRAHGQRFPLGGQYPQEFTLNGGRHLHGHLVGNHLNQRLVAADGITRLLQPLADGPLNHRFANVREFYRNCQLLTTCP